MTCLNYIILSSSLLSSMPVLSTFSDVCKPNFYFFLRCFNVGFSVPVPRLDLASLESGYHGLVKENETLVEVTPRIKAIGGDICSFRIVNKHHGEAPFEVRPKIIWHIGRGRYSNIVTTLWEATWPRNHSLILRKGSWFFSTWKHSYWLWSPPSLLFSVCQSPFPQA